MISATSNPVAVFLCYPADLAGKVVPAACRQSILFGLEQEGFTCFPESTGSCVAPRGIEFRYKPI